MKITYFILLPLLMAAALLLFILDMFNVDANPVLAQAEKNKFQ